MIFQVEIIANDQGNRTTPSYVAFTDTERLIGDAAKNQVAMNPANTVFGKLLIVKDNLVINVAVGTQQWCIAFEISTYTGVIAVYAAGN